MISASSLRHKPCSAARPLEEEEKKEKENKEEELTIVHAANRDGLLATLQTCLSIWEPSKRSAGLLASDTGEPEVSRVQPAAAAAAEPGIRKCGVKRREQETHSELQQRFLRVSSNSPAKSGLVPINNDEGMFFFPTASQVNKKTKKH